MAWIEQFHDAPAAIHGSLRGAGGTDDTAVARRVGAIVAAAIAGLIAAAEVALDAHPAFPQLPIGLLGLPGVALLGWLLGPGVWHGSASGAVGRGLAMGLGAQPLGVATFVLASLPSLGSSGPASLPTVIVGVPWIFVLGLVFTIGLLVITIPAGLVWAMAVRITSRVWR